VVDGGTVVDGGIVAAGVGLAGVAVFGSAAGGMAGKVDRRKPPYTKKLVSVARLVVFQGSCGLDDVGGLMDEKPHAREALKHHVENVGTDGHKRPKTFKLGVLVDFNGDRIVVRFAKGDEPVETSLFDLGLYLGVAAGQLR
jgi:hypothetical protein